MFVCVVSLSQMLYVKCLCVLSRYLSPVLQIWVIPSEIFRVYVCVRVRLQPHYITQGVEYTSIYSPTIWHKRISVIVQKGPSTSQSDLVESRIL